MKTCKMMRWEYFYAMGNNCRLYGMTTCAAQTVIDEVGVVGDAENFWHGFMYGTDKRIVSLPSIENVDTN